MSIKANTTITITNLPDISGLSFRHFTGEPDYAAMAEVRQQSKNHDHVDPFSTLENVPTADEIKAHINDDNCNPLQDIILAEVNGKVIGYSKIGWWAEKDGIWLYLHLQYLLPEWRDKGIDGAMLKWSEARIREIAKQHPTNGKGMYGTSATTTEKEKTELLKRHDYTPAFSMIEMEFTDFENLHVVPLPREFTIEPVLPEHIRSIWEANNEVYATRQFSEIPAEEDYQEFLNNPLNDYSLWTVAWSGNEIAGFVLGEIEKDRGKLEEVSIREKYRRKGLAYALIIKTLLKLKEKGITITRLCTNGENIAGAKSLYEKVGFHLLKTHVRYRKQILL